MMKRKIIIDCDPGHDDAIAILVAAAHPGLELLAITTVAGNAELGKTTLNALKVCEIAKLSGVPVARGAGRPLVRDREAASEIHGDSGMDGPILPDPLLRETEEHAVDLIIRMLMESGGDITLVPVGPLTNIAMAIRREPRIVPKIQEIVLMGGGTFGNWTPAAEFNIWADAEAAQVVFGSGAPVTMIGLDATHQALATPEINERIMAIANPVAGFVGELLTFFGKTYKEFFDFDAPPVHDVCSVVYCIDPSVFDCRFLNVTVETRGELSYGMTLVDIHGVTGRPPNATVALGLDHGRLWDIIIGALSRYK
ncbi:nucleoside hydrolase [Paenibacillus durus]|uniref:Ribonucleoside hydrolase n=1 Tax=Paenibacillus durus TaxID=44251 RepID=A0A089IRX1_PAEDU|nr:ribonucleoside hydrolase [Paenibacillus durus]